MGLDSSQKLLACNMFKKKKHSVENGVSTSADCHQTRLERCSSPPELETFLWLC